ncbi:actin remodeling regulator NHS-like [Anguilla rostrata]|uniref:actin remodeling regulator NHS-like n=1 Tax=Anguilla rostrata TaxID=7938 RepID=UPI0030CB227C
MPFAKRIVEPQLLCRHAIPNDEGLLFEDLSSINNVSLSRTLRQLSDLAKHACSLFQELENEIISTNQRVWALQNKIGRIQQTASGLDPKQEAVPVSNLDVESKLTAHYQAPWHQQRNVFHPSTRPACVEELHKHAKQNLRALNRDQQQRQRASSRERRVTISISVAPPMPSYPSPRTLRRHEQRSRHLHTSARTRSSSPTECCHFGPWSRKAPAPTDPDSEVVTLGQRPKCPVPNVPTTLDKQTNWSKALPLPTPEERLRNESQVISSCIIPINVTGVGFDREASVRCSLVHSQSVLQRRRKLRRRKTISGIPRRVQQDLDSDESPVARERTVIVHTNADFSLSHDELSLSGRLGNTKDSGCQTEDFPIAAPSRRRIRAQRGQGIPASLSHSTGNITSLPDSSDAMFAAAVGGRLRSRSLPREGGRLVDQDHDDSDDDDDDEEDDGELSPYEAEEFLQGPAERVLKDEEESTDDQAAPELQLAGLKCKQRSGGGGSPDHGWIERGRSRLPRQADMGSCEISSSSDTFSSPIHSVSATGVLGTQVDHKDDHQSSSGNWSGSSSTCPSQTSETIPPAASPPLTGSSHCDSELSLNAAPNAGDDPVSFTSDPYASEADQAQVQERGAGSFDSAAADLLSDTSGGAGEAAGVSEWNYLHHQHSKSCCQDFSPPRSRGNDDTGLGCPSFASMATYESLADKPPSEKADSSSHFSVDTEGYYTSMHFDCGLKESGSYLYNYAAMGSTDGHSQCVSAAPSMSRYRQPDHSSDQHRTLGRHCLSLKKPKVKPAPPKRCSSLRKLSGCVSVPDKNEPKMNSGQHLPLSSREMKLQLDLAGSPGQSQSENPSLAEEPMQAWGAEAADDITDSTLFSSTDTHSFKDEGAVQSDYADLWLLNDLKSTNDPYRSLSNSSTATGTTVIECIKSQESSESQNSQSGSRATTPSLPSVESEFKLASPEKLAGLASPSSGYSSQSETPTSSFPSAFFPGPLSPTSGKRKPKVPERKSSLSSLQQQQLSSRDGGTSSKRDLELPIIPPTHLDLSALHILNKPSAHRSQMHVLHQNKQKTPAVAAVTGARVAAASTKLEASAPAPVAITPTVLRSVQLRSVGRPGEGCQNQPGAADPATRPKCPTVAVITGTPARGNRSPESKKPAARQSQDATNQEHCETLFTQGNSSPKVTTRDVSYRESARHRLDRHAPAPFWAMTAFRIPSESTNMEEDLAPRPPLHPETQGPSNDPQAGQDCGALSESAACPSMEDSQRPSTFRALRSCNSLEEEPDQLPDPAVDSLALCLAKIHSPPSHSDTEKKSDFGPSDSPDEVPEISCQSEALQAYTISDAGSRVEEYDTSGVPRSASQDSREDGSTPDTEDYFSKESTPSDSAISPLTDETKPEDDSVFLSPSRVRTTEDLFAMIHRSKRKVLGRKDSGDPNARNRASATSGNAPPSNTTATSPNAPSTPTTPTAGSQRPPGPIYRSAKKSSTSNEEFKLLLLKKGSRTDSSYRMSATEILKSPITPKSPGDLGPGDSPREPEELPFPLQQSPSAGEHPPGPFPRANVEGFSPKLYQASAASRQGRSRVPPAASSSRYSARCRLYTAPMQAISEGETENSDGSPHDDRSSQASSS